MSDVLIVGRVIVRVDRSERARGGELVLVDWRARHRGPWRSVWRLPPLDLISTPRLQLRGLTELWSGFAVNFINPFVFFVWLGIISVASQRHPIDLYRVMFLGSCIAGILTLDLLKVHFAQRLRALLRQWNFAPSLAKASVA